MARKHYPTVTREQVLRLWFHRQGLSAPRGHRRLSRQSLTEHLQRTGALQLDSVNVLDRAHYLTLWSRFGGYDRQQLDRWIYDERLGYEYWGHEASILPSSRLATSRRRMRRFPPASWRNSSYWKTFDTSTASKRRVLRRLRLDGPLESIDFERRSGEDDQILGWGAPLSKEDKRSLKLLWHDGRVAVTGRRHFRCVYDIAERFYPHDDIVTTTELADAWLLTGLSGNGIASERHLVNYFTETKPKKDLRRQILARNLRRKRIVELRVDGLPDPFYALPEHLETLDQLPPVTGTTLLCPFDSLLWQRGRAEDLLGFSYRVEIYIPLKKRQFGYYVLPILHEGRLVGRLDPKLHRDRQELEIKSIHLEPTVRRNRPLDQSLATALDSLRRFSDAERLRLPKAWRDLDP